MSDRQASDDVDQRGTGRTASSGADPGQWRLAFGQLFDPHPSNVVLLGLDGTVLAVNAGWLAYARANGVRGGYEFVGRNYLTVCEAGVASGLASARDAYVGLLGVLQGGRPKFTMVYPCHRPTRREVYRMWIEPQSPSVPAVIVAHQQLESRPWSRGELAGEPTDGPAVGGALHAAIADASIVRPWSPAVPILSGGGRHLGR